ncbi:MULTISPECIES: hypothetical protein [Candidatus Ichthyocystis]|uniref:Uncharacterized protein n=1 Tax=Candidatus Ichthyocystis hellenicum TaxID=1561003 RepID=A0A0S4M2W6_9BURK|nr:MULTISPECIES: hypothetical protein [Ichthyocystis]CUT17568.1 hypothetical protein Ark11_0734 [Candidatus Ichthyocystis hellenicum]
MKKHTKWDTDHHMVDILFDEISQIYRVGNNICLHIGSDYGSESGTHILKKEKARLIIPVDSINSVVNDFARSRTLLTEDKEEEDPPPTENTNKEERLGTPFLVEE